MTRATPGRAISAADFRRRVRAWITTAVAERGWKQVAYELDVTYTSLRAVSAGTQAPGPKYAKAIGVTLKRVGGYTYTEDA